MKVGSSISLAVGASGNALLYQWLKDGEAIAGNESATTAILKLSNVQPADAGTYTMQVNNAGGTATSNAVTLKVSSTPVPPHLSARLTFPSAGVGDSASYYAMVSNSSGSIASSPAVLLVVSAMTAWPPIHKQS